MEFTQGARKNGRYQQHDNHDIGKLTQKLFQEGGSRRFFYRVLTKLRNTESGFFRAESAFWCYIEAGSDFCFRKGMKSLV